MIVPFVRLDSSHNAGHRAPGASLDRGAGFETVVHGESAVSVGSAVRTTGGQNGRGVSRRPACEIAGLPCEGMPNYRRARFAGGMYFFTVVTARRRAVLVGHSARRLLRQSISECRQRWPFTIVAMVLLPDHLHTIWTLPAGDADYSKRWSYIKRTFSQSWVAIGERQTRPSVSQLRHRRLGVWQRRFWEHSIRDEDDLTAHLDYIHFNPVKHGLVQCPHLWPHSTFHRFAARGSYQQDWCCRCGNKRVGVPEHVRALDTAPE